MPSAVTWMGAAAGGGVGITFTCSGCTLRKVTFNFWFLLEGSNRASVGTRLALAFLTTGHTYAEYRKTLGEHLGVRCYTENPFNDLIKICHPRVANILDNMMETAKVIIKNSKIHFFSISMFNKYRQNR